MTLRKQLKVLEIICKLDTAPSVKSLKLIIDKITNPINHITNESVRESIFSE